MVFDRQPWQWRDFTIRDNPRSAIAPDCFKVALSTPGHSGTWVLDPNASGDSTATLAGAILLKQVGSVNEESPRHKGWGVSKCSIAVDARFQDECPRIL